MHRSPIRSSPGATGALLVVMLGALTVASLLVGSQPVPLATVWAALTDYDAAESGHTVIHDLRLPRTVAGVLVGIALGSAGALTQAMTRNPLAEPGLLGINAGAAAAVAITLVWSSAASIEMTVGAAIVGAAASSAVVLMLGGAFRPQADPVRLVLAGAAVSIVLGSVTSALVIGYPDSFETFRNWDAGALNARPSHLLVLASVVIAAALILAGFAARSLDALSLGHDLGRALGASPRRTFICSGLACVLLAGMATAIAGPISFIGLAAPLIARWVVGPRIVKVLPLSAVMAAILLLVADLIGRVIVSNEVQAAIVAAVLGAPLFIALARRRRFIAL